MNILSLFDGMSCGRVALERCGFTINKYYAAEIDKYAIAIAQNNYLDTIHLGDVTQIKGADLEPIDIVIGGSPCQGFSFAGKQLNFNDPRSMLFFEFVRLVKECKPKYFFLENVVMKKEYQDVISKCLGVEPVMLNSSRVSAQSRKRLYWTNIPGYTEPEDKGILLKDIVHEGEVDRDKSYCIDANYWKGSNLRQYFEKSRRQIVFNYEEPYDEKYNSCKPVPLSADKFNCLRAQAGSRTSGIGIAQPDGRWRKLTPIECERLQTLPDNYTLGVSNSQRYKMLGNGWTVDAVCEFFKHIPKDLEMF